MGSSMRAEEKKRYGMSSSLVGPVGPVGCMMEVEFILIDRSSKTL